MAGWQEDRLLERFWFGADARHAPIRLLSGGERRRLQLLLVLAQRPNVLLLDEPTNDLDLDTLRSLEDFLEDWTGALVVVSHDRAFLERTVEDVLAFDGLGQVRMVPGGYPAWAAGRTRRRPDPTPARDKVSEAVPARAPNGQLRSPSAGAGARSPVPVTVANGSGRDLVRKTERELSALHQRHADLETELAAVGDDHVALARIGTELAEIQAAIAGAEDRWLALTVDQ